MNEDFDILCDKIQTVLIMVTAVIMAVLYFCM